MWVSRAEGRSRSRAVGPWAGLDEGSAGSACHKHNGGDGTSRRAQIRDRSVSLRGPGSALTPSSPFTLFFRSLLLPSPTPHPSFLFLAISFFFARAEGLPESHIQSLTRPTPIPG